jgi:hypothetical protein
MYPTVHLISLFLYYKESYTSIIIQVYITKIPKPKLVLGIFEYRSSNKVISFPHLFFPSLPTTTIHSLSWDFSASITKWSYPTLHFTDSVSQETPDFCILPSSIFSLFHLGGPRPGLHDEDFVWVLPPGLPAAHRLNLGFVNKVWLAYSFAHFFTHCLLLLLYQSGRDTMTLKLQVWLSLTYITTFSCSLLHGKSWALALE